ncbi:hypothetical protein A3K80_06475 [Candidatus Bathyarchaeota archaeon RBG_13_38_9]|nr:MAG: hypothetical protein A3K80_06475 [Candidatus Bathyarchaeota archaeon RBG_13_38_9]
MSIFKDKGALELDRLSVEVAGRSSEASRLRGILSSVNDGFLAKLVSVFGPPGSGKTLVVRSVCQDFEVASAGSFRFLYVNLGEVKTVFGCANRLLAILGVDLKAGRFGLDGVMEAFWSKVHEWRGEGRRFLLICFDEADRLFLDERGDPSGFLYRLVRSQDRLEGSGINLSLLMISNSPVSEIWELDGRVRSSMGLEEIFFKPYSREELGEILEKRCVEAFNPSVVDRGVVEACVNYTAEQSRDVRRMIDLLRVCGEVCEAQGDLKIEIKHFNEALKRFEMDHYKILFGGMADLQLELIHTMAWLNEFDSIVSSSTEEIFQAYKKSVGEKALSYRRVSSVLKELEVMNLIGTRKISRGRGGQRNEVWLTIPAETVLDFTRPDWREEKKKMEEFREKVKKLNQLERRLRRKY